MKQTLYNIALLLAVVCTLATSCKKEETRSLSVPSESILVSMPGETGTTTFDSSNIASISATTVPNGWTVNDIDLYTGIITVTAPTSFDDGEVKSGNLTLKGYSPTGLSTSVTIFVAILEKADIDFTDAPANCYVATQPETRYVFNPYVGGSATPLATETIEILWQTRKDLIKFLELRDGKATFYLERAKDEDGKTLDTVYSGNALIGARNAAGELIWSWHIWVTTSDPYADTITLNGQTLMNRNLGANDNSNGETDSQKILDSYGMFYQWGNKTPLVGPFSWNFAGNEDDAMFDANDKEVSLEYKASAAATGNVEWSTANPVAIITGNPANGYDWLYDAHDDALWSATTKSEYDPCPAGWHVPDSSVYATLTIAATDDIMPWQEAQNMYGWHLEDTATGEQYFFSAAGRRNYLDGRLDIVNTNPVRPIPWSGYYWTASTEQDKAVAMYFNLNSVTRTWNGFDASYEMYRANALPLRCVKE